MKSLGGGSQQRCETRTKDCWRRRHPARTTNHLVDGECKRLGGCEVEASALRHGGDHGVLAHLPQPCIRKGRRRRIFDMAADNNSIGQHWTALDSIEVLGEQKTRREGKALLSLGLGRSFATASWQELKMLFLRDFGDPIC